MPTKTDLRIVKAACDVPIAADKYDSWLDFLTGVVEEQVEAHYNIPTSGPSVIVNEQYWNQRSDDLLILKTTPVVSIQSISVFDWPDNPQPSILTSLTDYRLIDPDKGIVQFSLGTNYYPSGLNTAVAVLPYNWPLVEVSYTGGLAAWPSSVQFCVGAVVNQLFSLKGRPTNAKAIHVGDERTEYFDMDLWPEFVWRILAPFDRTNRVGVV